MIGFLIFFAWLLGAASTVSALLVLCERNPNSFEHCFTGGGSLLFIVIVFWPLFWPCYAIFKLTERIMTSK
jgi:hypothetical protein